MLNLFVKDLFIYTLPTIFSRSIGILLLPIYTRIVSPVQLGALDLFIAFGNLITIIVALEITQAISRYIPNAHKLAGKYAFIGLMFTATMYLILMTILVNYSDLISKSLTGSGDFEFEFLLSLAYVTSNAFYYYFQNLLRFSGKSVQFAVSSIIYAVSNLAFAFIFGFIFQLGLSGILLALFSSSLISSLISFLFIGNYFKVTFNLRFLFKLLKFSSPLVPSSILVIFGLYVDRYFISHYLGIENVGIYSVAFRIASVSSLVMIGFQMALTPLIYKHYKQPQTRSDLSLIFKYFTVLASLFFLIFSIFSQNILMILTTASYFDSSYIVSILILSFFFSQMYIFMPGINIAKKTHLFLLVNLIIAICNVLFNMILIPNFELAGAAAAKTASFFIGFLFFIFFSQKYYFVNHDWKKHTYNLIFALLIVFIYFYTFQNLTGFISLSVKFFLILLFISSMYISGLLKREDFSKVKSLIPKKQ